MFLSSMDGHLPGMAAAHNLYIPSHKCRQNNEILKMKPGPHSEFGRLNLGV